MMHRYWITKAAQEHVTIVQKKGYTQVNMGPRAPLEAMNVGDWIIYYSPTIFFEQEEPICELFTGIACINDHRIYPHSLQVPDRWKRNVDFYQCTPKSPEYFIGKVDFLPSNNNWKEILEQPVIEISYQDFLTITHNILIQPIDRILLL